MVLRHLDGYLDAQLHIQREHPTLLCGLKLFARENCLYGSKECSEITEGLVQCPIHRFTTPCFYPYNIDLFRL